MMLDNKCNVKTCYSASFSFFLFAQFENYDYLCKQK